MRLGEDRYEYLWLGVVRRGSVRLGSLGEFS